MIMSSDNYTKSVRFGLKTYTNAYSEQNFYVSNNQAILYSQAIISDTTNWTTLRGTFIADSAYRNVVIGNFFTNSLTDTISRPYNFDSYFFVDEVILSTDSMVWFSNLAESRWTNPSDLNIFFSEGYLNVDYPGSDHQLLITTVTGNLIYQTRLSEKIEIELSGLSPGAYLVRIMDHGLVVGWKKLLVGW